MHKYEDIRDELKKSKYIIYYVENNKYKQLLKFNGLKNDLISKLENKYNKSTNNNFYFICLKFGFHTGEKLLQGGPLSITINTFIFINNELKSGFTYDKKYRQIHGKVWFQRKFIEKFGWKDLYLENIVNKLINGKVNLAPLSINMYNICFE
jgi:hypothetical protein